ncbi:hypothetical protein [Streptomyces pacificus]|nr:hypothetical protein [Streptomyces pacificus]
MRDQQRGRLRGGEVNARFSAQEVLPLQTAERSIAEREDTVIMSPPEDAW